MVQKEILISLGKFCTHLIGEVIIVAVVTSVGVISAAIASDYASTKPWKKPFNIFLDREK
jgi:hypothetical protein